jgi:hypothetical protein
MIRHMALFAAAVLLTTSTLTISSAASATPRSRMLAGATPHGAAAFHRGRPWPGWSGTGWGFVGPGGGRGWFANGWGWQGANGYAAPLYVSGHGCGRRTLAC